MSKIERFLNYTKRSKDLIKIAFFDAINEALLNKSSTELRLIIEKLISLLELEETTNGENKSELHSTNRESKSIPSRVSNINGKKKGKNNQTASGGIQIKSDERNLE